MNENLNVTVIGTGYVGLVSGTCFAEKGFNVTCMDMDESKISNLAEKGRIPIYEPGLEEMVKRNSAAGRLSFTTDLSTCVPEADFVFIAVGTPQDEDGSADLRHVLTAAETLAQHLTGYTVIVDKSTVPVGTGRKVAAAISGANPSADFDVVSNPEFLREGSAISDSMAPDRIVVGVETERATGLVRSLYEPWTSEGAPLVETNLETAEIIKYAANAFLAAKITFINEMAALCDAVGADVRQVARGMGLDGRIGEKFLMAGPGYGGSCFPKDTNALAKTARDFSCPVTVVESVIAANERIKKTMAERILDACGGSFAGKKVAILGLAFKPETDDMRDAPALTILPELRALGAEMVAFDPEATENAHRLLPWLDCVSSPWEALTGADAAVILTEWETFKNLDLAKMRETMKGAVLVDLRNIFEPAEMAAQGFRYTGWGRGTATEGALQQRGAA